MGVAWPAGVAGQSRSDDPRLGREAFREGAEAARRSLWPRAVAAFERSYEARPHPVTSFNLGFAERATGHLTRSLRYFERALLEDREATRGELSDSQRVSARHYVAEILRSVASLYVSPTPRGLSISVDGVALEARGKQYLAGIARVSGTTRALEPVVVLVDPGVHIVHCAHPERRDQTTTIFLEPGERRELECVLEPLPRPSPGPDRTASILVGGFGLASLSVGTALGIAALSKQSDLDRTCPTRDRCDFDARSDIQSMRGYADASTIAFGVAVSALAISTWLWIDGSKSSPLKSGLSF